MNVMFLPRHRKTTCCRCRPRRQRYCRITNLARLHVDDEIVDLAQVFMAIVFHRQANDVARAEHVGDRDFGFALSGDWFLDRIVGPGRAAKPPRAGEREARKC